MLKSEPIYIKTPDDFYHYDSATVPYYEKDELQSSHCTLPDMSHTEFAPPTYSDGGLDVLSCPVQNPYNVCSNGCNSKKCTSCATNYTKLKNKPQINGVVLEGNKTFEDLGIYTLTEREIENIINSTV